MFKILLSSFLIFIPSFLSVAKVYALDLKIFDQMGLVRAFIKVKETGNVSIKLKKDQQALPTFISLSHIDGLSADKTLNAGEGGIYKINCLTAGSWKIVLPRSTFVVEEVKINEDQCP